MRALPLGAYVSQAGPLHAVDARVKLVLLVLATPALFSAGWPGLALAAAALVALVAVSGVGARSVVRALRPTAVVLALSLAGNALVASGADVPLAGGFGVSLAGLARGGMAVGRIVLMVGLALVMCATTTSTAVAGAVSWALGPLGRLGVPVGDLSMVLSVALRFLPLAAEELDRIADAQRSRGAPLSEGGVVRRLRAWAAVLVPLIVSLFRRADELAGAMRDRCWRPGTPAWRPGALGRRDLAVLAAGAACCLAVAVL